jgi:flagellum-specific ATP synthase
MSGAAPASGAELHNPVIRGAAAPAEGARRAPLAGAARTALEGTAPRAVRGTLTHVVGLDARAAGVDAAVGDMVHILGRHPLPAEVVAVEGATVRLAPLGSTAGLRPGDRVEPAGAGLRMRVGEDLRGRVLDGLGRPVDGRGPLAGEWTALEAPVPAALERSRINVPLPLGVRAVDTLLACGRGQRVGIFAGSGVGKSTLLGMLARGTAADVVVIALVGERGREVREFLEDDLGAEAAARAVTVVATSDEPPLLRAKAAHTATRVAEHFRDRGLDVLLLVDSLTRHAMALREIGLAAGEPPASRGYPPSVFAEMPRLLERAGPAARGTITALYTVLVEGDDMLDPVADHARSILDGHIVLSRRLAEAGHYPTIDVLASASRLASKVTPSGRAAQAQALRRLLAALAESKDLVEIGAYQPGTNSDVDQALARRQAIDAFLRQAVHEVADPEESWQRLTEVLR